MAKISLTVCDHCQSTHRPAREYVLSAEDLHLAVDLCKEHAQPLLELVRELAQPSFKSNGRSVSTLHGPMRLTEANSSAERPGVKPARNGARALPVTTMDEIEAMREGQGT